MPFISSYFSTRRKKKRYGGCRRDDHRDIKAFMNPYDVEAQKKEESAPLSLTWEQTQKLKQHQRKYDEAKRSMMSVYKEEENSQTDMSFSEEYVGYFESNKGLLLGSLHLCFHGLLSVWAYSYYFENWRIVDSIYFAVCTITTIGYGDLSPTTNASRLFTCVFALYGVCIVGFFINLAGQRLVEFHQQALKVVQLRTQQKVIDMFEARKRNGVSKIHLKEHEEDELKRQKSMHLATLSDSYVILKTVISSLPILSVTLGCGAILGSIEHWTVLEGLYFSIITGSTIGFGEFAPTTTTARAASIVLLPLMVGVFCEILRRIADAYMQHKIAQEESKYLHRQLTVEDLINMDTDNDGSVNFGEYLSFMLVAMHKIDEDEITRLRVLFDQLDTSGDGVLDKNDLRMARGLNNSPSKASIISTNNASQTLHFNSHLSSIYETINDTTQLTGPPSSNNYLSTATHDLGKPSPSVVTFDINSPKVDYGM